MAKHGHSSMAIKLQCDSLLRENRKWCDDLRLKVWTHSAWCSNGSNSFDLRNVLADTFTPVVLNAFLICVFMVALENWTPFLLHITLQQMVTEENRETMMEKMWVMTRTVVHVH